MPNVSSSKLYSTFALKCPTCHHGDMFPTGSFSFSQPFKQYKHCPACGQNYFPEPGFYYGAMFVSYIGSGFFCLGFVMLLHWVLDWSMGASFLALIAVAAVGFVWWFRFSRSAYIEILYPFKPEVAERVERGELRVPVPEVVADT